MAETSYPSSDIESGGEVDLASQWLKQAIYKEVSRGAKLRERKLGPVDTAAASKYSKPPVPARSVRKDCKRKSSSSTKNGLDQLRERARSNSPFQSTRNSSLSRRDSSSTSARRGRPMCSMRISELAVPTKRQCIDTWRKKASVLPEPMVQRLKQHVLDQTPIVKVSDAVICFSQSSSVSSKKRSPRKINKDAMISRNKEETQYISAIFGHKIAQKLVRPVNAKLNTQLQNVSSVISSEICNIMRDKTKLKTDLATHERMVRETADKVTIWIANILEETSEKLLEEDLKELEEQEGPALDVLDDLVDNVLSVCGGAESDSEDLFDAASSIRKISDDYISASSEHNDETDLKAISPVQQALEEYLDEADKVPEDEEESLKNELMTQLNNIIDSNVIAAVKSTDDVENLGKETASQPNIDETAGSIIITNDDQADIESLVDRQEYVNEPNNLEKEEIPLENTLNQIEKADSESKKEANFTESLNSKNDNSAAETKAQSDEISGDKVDENINLVADAPTNNTDENIILIADPPTDNTDENTVLPAKPPTDNTDDNLVLLPDPPTGNIDEQKSNMSTELLSEDRDKKVQFSYANFGIPEIKNSMKSIEKTPERTSGLLKEDISRSQSHDKPLRDMNEPWPEDLSIENLVKPGESVSKSVTSLGKILESDERNVFTPEDSFSAKDQSHASHVRPDSIEQYNNFGINYEDFLNDDENKRKNKHNLATVEVNRDDLNSTAEQNYLKDGIKIVAGETDVDQGPKQAEAIVIQGEIIPQTTYVQVEDTLGLPKHSREAVDQQELSAQIKGKELEASLNQLKQQIKKMNIQHESSEPSLVSVMLSKLQKHDEKSQSVSDREQSETTKIRTALSEPSKSTHRAPQSPKSKFNGKLHQRYSRSEKMGEKKFDYRVHPSTAPSWIRRGRGQGDLGGCPRPQTCSGMNGMRERELEIRRRCKDLDKILMNLEKWKTWLEYITKYITSLKQKAEYIKPTMRQENKNVTCERPKQPRNVEKDMWTKLNHRAKGGLKVYKNDDTIKFKISPTPAPAKYCYACGKKQMKRPRALAGKETLLNTAKST